MIDHFGFGVSDYARSKDFYGKVLGPLGIGLVMDVPASMTEAGAAACGFGRGGKPAFWIGAEGKTEPRMHIAFTADTRQQVDDFYREAIAAGAMDNGAPGLRPQYHPNYYSAFVLDLDGHNIEAVCHAPA